MARHGVWELNEILLRYCLRGGSSRGVREFVEQSLPAFAERNPQISIKTKIQGGHPCVYGKYITGYERCIGLKNLDPERIDEVFTYLRNTLGRKVPKHNEISIGVVERAHVSVQGFWRNTPSIMSPELPEIVEKRRHRREEYGLQDTMDEMGVAGVIQITKKLLERQEAGKQAALAKIPKEVKVPATE